MFKKPLSLRERGWGEGAAKAVNAEKNGLGKKVSLLTIVNDLACLRRTLIFQPGEARRAFDHSTSQWLVSAVLSPPSGHLLPEGEGNGKGGSKI